MIGEEDDLDVDDLEGEEPADDETAARALKQVRAWFEGKRTDVFYSRQLEILLEKPFFHWVTNRAITALIEEGLVVSDPGGPGLPNILRHNSHRYPRRQIKRVRDLIAEYTDDAITHQIGEHCESLVERAFFHAGFRFIGQKVKGLDGKKWTETNHDLDFVVEKDGRRYGVEIKNQLGYTNLRKEIPLKTRLALHLGCTPLFVARFLPKTWNWEIIKAGGFSLLFKTQMQHPAHESLANRMRNELLLPVTVVKAFPGGDLRRFLNWHDKQVGR